MIIEVKTVPHKEQRYDTLGDWVVNEKTRFYSVSELGNEDYEFLIAIHEMIEHALCMKRGITQEEVDKFDMNYDGDNPGSDRLAPYHKEHVYATAVEYSLCKELGINQKDYDEYLENFLKKQKE